MTGSVGAFDLAFYQAIAIYEHLGTKAHASDLIHLTRYIMSNHRETLENAEPLPPGTVLDSFEAYNLAPVGTKARYQPYSDKIEKKVDGWYFRNSPITTIYTKIIARTVI